MSNKKTKNWWQKVVSVTYYLLKMKKYITIFIYFELKKSRNIWVKFLQKEKKCKILSPYSCQQRLKLFKSKLDRGKVIMHTKDLISLNFDIPNFFINSIILVNEIYIFKLYFFNCLFTLHNFTQFMSTITVGKIYVFRLFCDLLTVTLFVFNIW